MRSEGNDMRCFGLILVLVAASCVSAGCSRPKVPTVTVLGAQGDQDLPSLTFSSVTLKAGDTLLVSCNDEGGDVKVTWNGMSLHLDAGPGKGGGGFHTTIFSLYSATGGTGDIVASHGSGGDLSINAYSVTNLAASALDQTSTAEGNGTSPSSGATPVTTKRNEFLWAAIGYSTNDTASGAWSDGFMSGGAAFTATGGGIGGVDNAYKTVSSTGAYEAAKTGVTKDYWSALIATYAIAP
jgi:hypothetical protein